MDGKTAWHVRVLFSEWYKIMVNKATFTDFKGGDRPLDPPLSFGCLTIVVCPRLLCSRFDWIILAFCDHFLRGFVMYACCEPKVLQQKLQYLGEMGHEH